MIRRVMAKKDRFPDAYSSGFPPSEESEGSGCSGRDHTETSGYENSIGPKKKWIKLSSAFHDGFGVPIRCVPLSTLPSSDKQKWLLRLRSELDQVRTFQKKVDTVRTHVPISSSSNIKVQNQTNTIKQTDLQVQKPGRFQSVNEPVQSETFSLILKKQCDTLLKKLMTHQHGWVFNKPVDVIALKIPDYFNVIKKPMDLGTVKGKLGSGNYSSPFPFVADVRLTFSNAMTYNPPGNDVHIMADILSKFFELRWKPIEKKLTVNNSQKQQQQKQEVHEVIDLAKPNQISKKRKVTSIPQNVVPEKVNFVMTSEEKLSLTRELETHLGDLPDSIIEYLKKHGSNGETGEDEIEIDIDALNDESLFQLRKMLDDHSRQKQNHAKAAEPCVIELLNESGLSNSTMQLYKGNDIADEDVDAGGNEPPVSSNPPIELDKGSASGSDHAEQISNQKPNSIESDSQKDEGDSAPNERQVSPDKLYRAALLKNRFADTILKAREKTLNQDEKADPEKLRREKELLEDQKRKEKARLQAEAKAAEDARRKVEAEAAAEAKRKRGVEREAARQALLKMEKTVEIDESSRFLKDLEMLPSSLEEISPEGEMEELGSFKFGIGIGGSNALEQLGLYMKMDDDEHEDEEAPEVGPVTVSVVEGDDGVVNNEVEEGEIN